MKIPRYTTPLRSSDQWPKHKAKARQRKALRAQVAHAAQNANDRAAARTL